MTERQDRALFHECVTCFVHLRWYRMSFAQLQNGQMSRVEKLFFRAAGGMPIEKSAASKGSGWFLLRREITHWG